MDRFTVDMVVQAIERNDSKALGMLAALTQNQTANILLPYETETLVRSLIGRKCIVSWNMPATVVGVNTSVGGFYPGHRYPLVCKLDSGAVFEYSFDGFSLVENEGDENAY